MQAPRTSPVDFECKDKFLIQSTIVSAGTSDEEITANTVSICGCSRYKISVIVSHCFC